MTFVIFLIAGAQAQFSVGLIGTATPDEWARDTNMVQNDMNPDVWELDITLTDGVAKFRANDDWDINWGALDFPAGIGTQGGPDIPIWGGDYHVTLDTSTGAYLFDVKSPMGILGDATPNGWDEDTNMYQDQDNPSRWFVILDLVQGPCKFRFDDNWDLSWGGATFPEGSALRNDPTNIEVTKAGEYMISIDTAALTYSFEEVIAYTRIGLIGPAVTDGWDQDTAMVQSAADPNVWTLDIDLVEGDLKFRANNDWIISWGGGVFPMDTATIGSQDNIAIPTAGRYRVSFNTETSVFYFQEIINYSSIGIVGTAVNGDFTTITPMNAASDEDWELRMELSTGDLLFVGNNDLANFWGGSGFPSGTAERGNATTISVAEGDYKISFNSITGIYNFDLIIEWDAISLVGKSGPFGGWPEDGDMGARDFFLTVDAQDPHSWTGSGVTLTDHLGANDDGVKFRADTAWTTNWGAEDYPAGVGTQDGANIICVAGTYDLSFNDVSGEYMFGPVSSTGEVVRPENIKLFPNPTDGLFTMDFGDLEVFGPVQIRMFDNKGTEVLNTTKAGQQIMSFNVENLSRGLYHIQVRNHSFLLAKKLFVQ